MSLERDLEGPGGYGEIAMKELENAGGEHFQKKTATTLALKEYFKIPQGFFLDRGTGMLETASPRNLTYRDASYPYPGQKLSTNSLPIIGLYITSADGRKFYHVKRAQSGCHYIEGAARGKNLVLRQGRMPGLAGYVVKVRVAGIYIGE